MPLSGCGEGGGGMPPRMSRRTGGKGTQERTRARADAPGLRKWES